MELHAETREAEVHIFNNQKHDECFSLSSGKQTFDNYEFLFNYIVDIKFENNIKIVIFSDCKILKSDLDSIPIDTVIPKIKIQYFLNYRDSLIMKLTCHNLDESEFSF